MTSYRDIILARKVVGTSTLAKLFLEVFCLLKAIKSLYTSTFPYNCLRSDLDNDSKQLLGKNIDTATKCSEIDCKRIAKISL